jgi:lipid-A-disaccharide synthase
MKYYLIAGEASGDLHGSNLIKELSKLDNAAIYRCWGGDKMQAQGANLVKHFKDLAFMGFIEVVKNLPTILKNLSFCKRDIDAFVPDVLVLIDYPGFNLRIADWAKKKGIKTVYYISPQVWAWKESRVKKIKECVDKMLVILPFEERFYQKWQYPVEYVGHPLVEVIDQFKALHSKTTTQKSIAVLPGSRKQEIETKLPIMLSVAKHFPDYNFVVAKAPGVDEAFYQKYLNQHNNVSSVSNNTYSLLLNASAAMVTSGTATLETALFGVPEVVCYKGSFISYAIAKRLLTIKYISLVNLIMNKLVVQELIQDELNENNLHQALKSLLNNDEVKSSLQAEYKALHQLLSKGGNASKKAALAIYQFVCK